MEKKSAHFLYINFFLFYDIIPNFIANIDELNARNKLIGDRLNINSSCLKNLGLNNK